MYKRKSLCLCAKLIKILNSCDIEKCPSRNTTEWKKWMIKGIFLSCVYDFKSYERIILDIEEHRNDFVIPLPVLDKEDAFSLIMLVLGSYRIKQARKYTTLQVRKSVIPNIGKQR